MGNRTIKLPVGRSSVKNDLMTSLLSELLDEANEDDDDGDGDGATNDATNDAAGSGGGAPLNRLKPNTNFLTRLVSSAERSNRRIIAEVCRAWVPCGVFAAGQVTTCARVQATGLPQAKRKAKAKGKQLISKSFCTCRRRCLPPAVVNGMTNSLGPFCVGVCCGHVVCYTQLPAAGVASRSSTALPPSTAFGCASYHWTVRGRWRGVYTHRMDLTLCCPLHRERQHLRRMWC